MLLLSALECADTVIESVQKKDGYAVAFCEGLFEWDADIHDAVGWEAHLAFSRSRDRLNNLYHEIVTGGTEQAIVSDAQQYKVELVEDMRHFLADRLETNITSDLNDLDRLFGGKREEPECPELL